MTETATVLSTIEVIAPIEETLDEMVVYLVVNTDLGMGVGKTAAQVGHAVHYLGQKRDEILATLDKAWWSASARPHLGSVEQQALDFNRWHNSETIAKIVLAADAKAFATVKAEFDGRCVIVRDAGRTEIPSGSKTVIGIYPMLKSTAPKTLKRLRLLK